MDRSRFVQGMGGGQLTSIYAILSSPASECFHMQHPVQLYIGVRG